MYEDGVFPTPDGKARFVLSEHQATADVPDAQFPISLLSGRMRDHWHGMSRTGTVPRLFNLDDEPLVAMHPCDMRHRGLSDGDLVRAYNTRGSIVVRVAQRAGLQKGRAWMPMHWGSQFMNSPGVNALACDATDPYSRQPELKHAAVQIERMDLPYPLAVVRRCQTQAEALAMLEAARCLLADFPYASISLYGRQTPLVVLRAASREPVSEDLLRKVDALFAMQTDVGAIFYHDASRFIAKKAIVVEGRLYGVRLAGESLAQIWLKQAMAEDELDASLIRFALAPSARPPVSVAPRNIICKCADISDVQIQAELDTGASLTTLQDKLKCGTFCGSCVPDIKKMLAAQQVAAQAA